MLFKISCLSGWLLFAILLWYVRQRVFTKAADLFARSGNEGERTRHVEQACADLSQQPWLDSRDTLVFIGDSHIEMGNWYAMFRGRFSIRNAGISMSRIQDTTTVAESLATVRPKAVVVQCGINNLGNGENIAKCLVDLDRLFKALHRACSSQRVLFLSVMPVVERPLDSNAGIINKRVAELNRELKKRCADEGFYFADITKNIVREGGLNPELSQDGLHLNTKGYQAIAPLVGMAIDKMMPACAH